MSFQVNAIEQNNNNLQRTQRIYIDPERLIQLKNKKKAFRMVPSVFQPPQEILKDENLWENSTNNSTLKINNRRYSNQVFSEGENQLKNDVLPQQKLRILEQILQQKKIAPNVEYIWKLLPYSYKKQIINFQEGDCIPLNSNNSDKFLILTGQIRIVGINQHSFKRKQGYILFLSNQTKLKIKEIIVLRSTKILKITNQIFQNLLKNYLYLKNSQKIKFIKYCPFFIWRDELTEDLAACMQMKFTQKQEIVYQAHSNPDAIYFVKEGIVLLQRNIKVTNPVISDYQLHYEKNQITDKDTILVVRKGMAFGIDGIIIKELSQNLEQNHYLKKDLEQQIQNKNTQNISIYQPEQNPEKIFSNKSLKRKNQRIYTARTLGKCQFYVLDKKILQTLFSVSDINQQMYMKRKEISQKELQRMSVEYTNVILSHTFSKQFQVSLKKKDLVLNLRNVQNKQPTTKNHFQKSKSVAILQKNQNLQVDHKKFLKKRQNLSLQKKIEKQRNQKYQIKFDEMTEKIQMQNRVKLERKKQPLMGIRRTKNDITIGQNNDHILPKLIGNKSQNRLLKSINKLQIGKDSQRIKINDIINLKIKNCSTEVKNQDSLQNQKLNRNISEQKSMQQNNLYKSNILQNQNSKKNAAFINIKSYKSIVFNYGSNL